MSAPYSNISEPPNAVDYVQLKGWPSSQLRPLFSSMHALELMSLEYVEISFEEWRLTDFNPAHSFVWFRAVSKILSVHRNCEEVLEKTHQYILHRFLRKNGYSDHQLSSMSDLIVKKSVAHVCSLQIG